MTEHGQTGAVARRILITGATGNLAGKLTPHFRSLGWRLRLVDIRPEEAGEVVVADLSSPPADWAHLLEEIDTVVHLAAASSPWITWDVAARHNVDVTCNVMQAAAAAGVRRIVFASSNWVVAGHKRKPGVVLDSRTPPAPVNPYGASKLFGERLGAAIAANTATSVICLRIGWCAPGPNPPCPPGTLWDQRLWLSDQDMAAGFALAVTAADSLRFARVNLVSDNAGMAWALEEGRALLGYTPVSRSVPDAPA